LRIFLGSNNKNKLLEVSKKPNYYQYCSMFRATTRDCPYSQKL